MRSAWRQASKGSAGLPHQVSATWSSLTSCARAGRPGPASLWQRFDRTVQRLGVAMEGQIMCDVALQYRELAAVMHEIADVLLGETPNTGDR